MLQDIRDKSQGWIAKTLIGGIGVLLMLTGYQTIFNHRSSTTDETAAEVNGEKITVTELNESLNAQRQRMIHELGPQFDPSILDDPQWKKQVLEGLIRQRLLMQDARHSGLVVTDRDVKERITQATAFQVNGKFDPKLYVQTVRQMGYPSPQQFIERLKNNLTLSQLQAGIAATEFATDAEVKAMADLQGQTRDIAVQTLSTDPNSITVSDDDISHYYQEHGADFTVPEQVVVEYLELKKQNFAKPVQISDEKLHELYSNVSAAPEQRRAAHILIAVGKDGDADKAKAKIEAIRKRLEQGEDFAKLAKETSEDKGSAANDGDLGYATEMDYDPEFAKALFALNKPGEISQPVRTSYGWHLIKLLDVKPGVKPSFESVRDSLAEQYRNQEAQRKLLNASRAMEDAAFESSDLSQPAEDLGLKVQTSPPFGRDGGTGIAAAPQVVRAAFGDDVLQDGNNSALIEPDPNTALVLRVKEHHQPKQKPLEQVQADIRKLLIKQKTRQASKERGEKLIAQLQAQGPGASADAWHNHKAIGRQQTDLDPAITYKAFAMPRPEAGKASYAGVSLHNGDYAVIRLNKVNEPTAPLGKQETDQLRQQLAASDGQRDFMAYYQGLHDSAKIKIEHEQEQK